MYTIAGPANDLSDSLAPLLARGQALRLRMLINADSEPDAAGIAERCRRFSEQANPPALVVTILRAAPPGLAALTRHAANAAIWAFTRHAALDWAPKDVRVNAIGLGTSPAGPDEAQEQSGRAAADMPAIPATPEDVVRTILAMAAWPSMTGQIIRLGAA